MTTDGNPTLGEVGRRLDEIGRRLVAVEGKGEAGAALVTQIALLTQQLAAIVEAQKSQAGEVRRLTWAVGLGIPAIAAIAAAFGGGGVPGVG